MEMNEADIFYGGYTHQFQPEPTHKIHLNIQNSSEHLSNDPEDHPNQHKNSHKLCDEMGYPTVTIHMSTRILSN